MQFLNENEQEQSGIGMDEERERRVLHADNLEQLALLFGSLDENIETVAQRTGARIGSVGTEITVTGTREQADLACTVLEKLIAMLRRNEKIDKSRINYAVELAKEGNADMIDAIMQDVIAITARGRQVRCKTLGQRNYVKAVRENVVTFAVGPAGTGKTYLAMAMAVVAFKNKEVERIILTRPAVEAGEKLGFLPGDLQNKVDPYLRPLYDALYELMGVENFQKYLERGVIEVAPLAYMQLHHTGRGAEHHLRADEDVPDALWRKLPRDRDGGPDADRPARGEEVGTEGGRGGAARRGRHRRVRADPPRRGAPQPGAGHRQGLREVRKEERAVRKKEEAGGRQGCCGASGCCTFCRRSGRRAQEGPSLMGICRAEGKSMACSERELFPQRGIAACLSPHFRGQERGVQGGAKLPPPTGG